MERGGSGWGVQPHRRVQQADPNRLEGVLLQCCWQWWQGGGYCLCGPQSDETQEPLWAPWVRLSCLTLYCVAPLTSSTPAGMVYMASWPISSNMLSLYATQLIMCSACGVCIVFPWLCWRCPAFRGGNPAGNTQLKRQCLCWSSCIAVCSGPPVAAGATFDCGSSSLPNTTCNATCNDGYRGAASAICQQNGAWGAVAGGCSLIGECFNCRCSRLEGVLLACYGRVMPAGHKAIEPTSVRVACGHAGVPDQGVPARPYHDRTVLHGAGAPRGPS